MSHKNLPGWIKPHLFIGKNFEDLNLGEIELLKQNIKKFQSQEPEVSIVIPAWNEKNNIYRTLSSLSSNITKLNVEIIVINNNSTDNTQSVLDTLGVRSFFQPKQGITFARQMGLEVAKGTFHLCADSDTFYPPRWIEAMVNAMKAEKQVVGVYGRYSFIPPAGENRLILWLYERMTGFLIRIRKRELEYINFLGFNMGFVREIGLRNGGFEVTNARKFENARDSNNFVAESEDGTMALNLQRSGKLLLVSKKDARVYTSSRRLVAEGGLVKSLMLRINIHRETLKEYLKM